MINILVERTNPKTNEIETILKKFDKDKDSFIFLEQIEAIKMQMAYDSLNLGTYNQKRPIKKTFETGQGYFKKPLTKKQKENNTLYKKLCESVTPLNIKIWHEKN